MCGISGFNFRSESMIRAMNGALGHRGPDGESFYIQDNLTLGHTRLSIIDLTAAGSQPMFYSYNDHKVCIVFNGEIYNYVELKSKLLLKGYSFFTHADTEVIMAAYMEWGEECVAHFNGMWAFCLYDSFNEKLFCSRDRLGVKPFYYYNIGEKFIFSSEIKALVQHTDLNIPQYGNISDDAVDFFFSLGYIPSPFTIYKCINKLEAGFNLIYDLRALKITGHYSYYEVPKVHNCSNKHDLINEGKSILKDAVGLRMRSDVPVGAFLSGGLDSSAVVGEMKYFTKLENLHTFSIGFEDRVYDESRYIHLVKDYFSSIHHHYIYKKRDFDSFWPRYAEVFDEPFGDYSAFPTYKVCDLARGNVTVTLSGDGGDEIFGGYPVYNVGWILEKTKMLPHRIRKLLYRTTSTFQNINKNIAKTNEVLKLSFFERKDFLSNLFTGNRYKPEIYKQWTSEKLSYALKLTENNLIEALRVFDLLQNTLSNSYLVKVDRTSMANSLEVRSPFLDYRFIEYAQKIPWYWKVGFKKNKILMRELVGDILPKKIVSRGKMGFTPPINKWLYESISAKKFEIYHNYLRMFNEDLFNFYKQVIVTKERDYMNNYYMIKLAIFGNWLDHWILEGRNYK